MACFSKEWLEQVLIWLVIACVIVGIAKVLIPTVLSWFGAPPGGGAVMTILGYILWGIVAVMIIVFVFDLLTCALGGAAVFRLPR